MVFGLLVWTAFAATISIQPQGDKLITDVEHEDKAAGGAEDRVMPHAAEGFGSQSGKGRGGSLGERGSQSPSRVLTGAYAGAYSRSKFARRRRAKFFARRRRAKRKNHLPPLSSKPLTASWWKQCTSEGGSKNCAKCVMPGDKTAVLRCDVWPKYGDKAYAHLGNYHLCPDDLSRGFFIFNNAAGWRPSCGSFGGHVYQSSVHGSLQTYTHAKMFCGKKCTASDKKLTPYGMKKVWTRSNSMFLPGLDGTLKGTVINSKATTVALNHMVGVQTKRHGGIMFKRLVLHNHSSKKDRRGKPLRVADVFKIGICVKCPSPVWSSILPYDLKTKEHKVFWEKCVKPMWDSSKPPRQKKAYKCDNKEMEAFQLIIANF